MAFGNTITTGTKLTTGTYGYTVAFDLKNWRCKEILEVDLMANSVLGDVLTLPIPLPVLNGYVSDPACPRAAFSQIGTILFIFLKTAVYPYQASTEMGVDFLRDFIPPTALASLVDVPPSYRGLLEAIIAKKRLEANGQRVPFDVSQRIVREKAALSITEEA